MNGPHVPNDHIVSEDHRTITLGARRGVAVAGVLILLVLAVGAFSGTVSDAPCGGCHRLSAAASEAHEKAQCYECHASGSADGLLAAKSREVLMLAGAVAGVEASGTTTTPPRSACVSCHDDVLMGTIESGGIRINHGTCAGPAQPCTDCHWGVGHDSAARPGRGIAMDRCMECHDSITASWSCSTCHLDSGHADRPSVGSWAITHGSKWRTAHGMGDLGTCGACHEKTLCERCHGVPLPHPGGYVNGKHGEEAKPDTARCVTCHEQSFCDDCHGIAMPHPAEFLPTHSSLVNAQGDDVCQRCHLLEDCELCHVSHVHPGHL